MRRHESPLATILIVAVLAGPARGGSAPATDFGQAATATEIARLTSIPPNGAGLPPGYGNATQGRDVFASQCSSCHGEKLEGVKEIGGPALVGGRDTLATSKPIKTVESYWPYATTVFDYVRRAMPFNAPGSLSDDDVYAVTAYILASGGIIKSSQTLDAASLPQVAMPNREGFVADPRPR